MARGGLYKSDIQKARQSLLAQGKHPSVDAIRVALGNTGSKTTIHRYLKELEAEQGLSTGARVGVSDALFDLVQRLAAQLQQDADQVVEAAETRHRGERSQAEAALTAQRQESTRFATALQASEVALGAEREGHQVTRRELVEAKLALATQATRIDGLISQLEQRDTHVSSLEQKHSQAREALEHFRTAAKEQRDQEIQRHDHAVQQLQLELRQATHALTAKNHELQKLNRDNGRLLEQAIVQERELASAHTDLQTGLARISVLETELNALRPLVVREQTLAGERDQLLDKLLRAEQSLQAEIDRHRSAAAERDRALGRLQALEEVVKAIGQRMPPEPMQPDLLPGPAERGNR